MSYVMVNRWQGSLQSVDDTVSHSKGLAGPLRKVLSWILMGCPWGCSKAKCWRCWILVFSSRSTWTSSKRDNLYKNVYRDQFEVLPDDAGFLIDRSAGPLWSFQLFSPLLRCSLVLSLLVSRYRKRLYLCLKWHCRRPRLQTDQFCKDLGDWENLFDPS